MDANQPVYSLANLTDAELREYRSELEHSLAVISPDAPVRSLLGQKLFEVLGVQASRPSPETEESAMPEGEGETVSNR
jgi:hypothetical protein